MYEKHIWICAFMLCGAARECNIGEVDADHSDEVSGANDNVYTKNPIAIPYVL